MEHLRSLLGIFFLLGIAWLLSNNRRRLPIRVIIWGLVLQFVFAFIILKTGLGKTFFFFLQGAFLKLLEFSNAGAGFLFGKLLLGLPASPSVQVIDAGSGELRDLAQIMNQVGPVFAFRVLPAIIFFASLMSILYYLRIMQFVVKVMAWVMSRTMGTSGAETISAAANIFLGMVEAPLMVRPYISRMTGSELNSLMVGGFATIAGGVMAAYVSFGLDAGHLMSASVMSAPAALLMAKIIFPETGTPETGGSVKIELERSGVNLIDAAASGAVSGLKLALNVGAMLIAFIALIALLNYFLSLIGTSLEKVLGIIFYPVAFFLGIPLGEIFEVSGLLGTKIAVNEFVAYIDLSALKGTLSPRSVALATYALCGFANFGSIAMMIGGLGGIAPERKSELAKLGLKAMLGGALASWLTAAIAGIFLG